MKRLIVSLTFLSLFLGLFAQTKSSLKSIGEKLTNLQDYQSHCIHTFSILNGDNMTVEVDMTAQKNDKDTLCGFYYYFKTNEKYKEVFGDFNMYFKQSVYSSYRGVIKVTRFSEEPEKFKYGNIPPIHKNHQLFSRTPYQIGELILNSLKNKSAIITQQPDTVIGKDSCIQFKIDVPFNNEFGGGTIYDITFKKQQFYPLSFKNIYYDKKRELCSYSVTRYSNTKLNSDLSSVYFNEENLLGRNWKTKTYLQAEPKTINLIGQNIPQLKLPVLNQNDSLTNDEFKGKYVLLEFTATWCGHCIEAAKFINVLEENFQNSEDIVIVSVFSNKYDKKENVLRFVKANDVKSTVLYQATNCEEQFNINGYPHFFIISPEGIILKSFPGYSESFNEEIMSFFINITKNVR